VGILFKKSPSCGDAWKTKVTALRVVPFSQNASTLCSISLQNRIVLRNVLHLHLCEPDDLLLSSVIG
jgi:hypothetical protein